MNDQLASALRFVTEHNLVVIVLMLALTAGVAAGTSQLQLESQANGSDAVGDTEVAQKLDYVRANFGNESERRQRAPPAAVYVRDSDGNALSKANLLDSLRFQQRVRENDSVAAALDGGEVFGVANLVARRAAGREDPTLDEQVAALEAASESDVSAAVSRTLSEGSPALRLVSLEYEPGTASATSTRLLFRFAPDTEDGARAAATKAIYDASRDRDDPEYFTVGEHAIRDASQHFTRQAFELALPIALLMILAVLAFSYRDLVDVIVGFTGVALSVLWMFGILGWLAIPAGLTLVVGPVLIVGLSVDYGLHVFMRYREERGAEEGIREPMFRGLSAVSIALALVTLTAGVGFMSNVTNEFTEIRELAMGITLGVFSTFVVSLTVVPALKVTIDGLLERVGLDRRKRALGKTRLLEPVLGSGAALARSAALAVIVVALVAGTAGAVAWTDLDRQSFQQGDRDVAEWKQDLPEPLGWDVHEYAERGEFVDARYRAADEDRRRESNVLLEGDVATTSALESVREVHERAGSSAVVFQRDGAVPVRSPLTVMESVAAENDEFATVYREADTDGDGVPEEDVAAVYDALFEAAPAQASAVIHRSDGDYRAVRVVVPVRADAAYPDQADAMRALAAEAETDAVSAIAVGIGTVNAAESAETAENILRTLLVALAAVAVLLTVVYRFVAGSATLGAVTALPIALVTALVIGGMWVLDVPLTLLTTLLLSLVIGLGIDYNIHVSDRFVHEINRGRSTAEAVYEAVTGTGGALLGSTLTSVGAFSTLLLIPSPQMESFGTLVVLALSLSFVVAVFVLPSLLTTWARYVRDDPLESDATSAGAAAQD